MHVDFQGSASPTGFGGGLGAAGSLTDSFLQVKLVDWDAPAPAGLAGLFVGGPGGIPFGPPDPKIAIPICQELDRFNVSAKVRLAAWETAIVESGVKIPPTNDGTSLGPFQQISGAGWGTAAQRLDPHHSAAEFIRHAQAIEHRYADAGTLAQAVQRLRVPPPLRAARRPGGGAQRQVLRGQVRRGLACAVVACLALVGCGGGSEHAVTPKVTATGTAPPASPPAKLVYPDGAQGRAAARRDRGGRLLVPRAGRAQDDGRQLRACGCRTCGGRAGAASGPPAAPTSGR